MHFVPFNLYCFPEECTTIDDYNKNYNSNQLTHLLTMALDPLETVLYLKSCGNPGLFKVKTHLMLPKAMQLTRPLVNPWLEVGIFMSFDGVPHIELVAA